LVLLRFDLKVIFPVLYQEEKKLKVNQPAKKIISQIIRFK